MREDNLLAVAALVTAVLGGLATLVVGVATLIATVRGNREIAETRSDLNGRLDSLVAEATTRAYLQGVKDGEARSAALAAAKPGWKPALPSGAVSPPIPSAGGPDNPKG